MVEMKIKEWNRCLIASGLNKQTKLLAYNRWLPPSVKYKVFSCSMAYDECEKMMSILALTLFHAYGIVKACSRVVLYVYTKMAGLHVCHLYQQLGMEKVKFFM